MTRRSSFSKPITNPSRVIRFFYDHPSSSRAQAARELGLTPAAVTIITSRLIKLGVLIESREASASKNGRAVGLSVDATKYKVIGVKFARSRIELGVFDIGGNLQKHHVFPPAADTEATESLHAVREKVRALIAQDPSILSVGIAVPGPYLRNLGRLAIMTNMPAWRSINFKNEFETAFSVPTIIEQDARAGALAQSLFDPTSDSTSLAYYILGEGIGVGIIENGVLINGQQGAATEIGHISIDVNGPMCECGNHGCLERYCSAISIHRTLVANYPHLVPNAAELTHSEAVTQLCALADNGNPEARGFVKEIGRYVGYGCVSIINAYNPHHIIMGDILAAGGQLLLDSVNAVVEERVLPDLRKSTTITLSRLPADPILSGAAAAAIDHLLRNPSEFGK